MFTTEIATEFHGTWDILRPHDGIPLRHRIWLTRELRPDRSGL